MNNNSKLYNENDALLTSVRKAAKLSQAELEDLYKNKVNEGLTFGVLKGKALAFSRGEITSQEFQEWQDSLIIKGALLLAEKLEVVTLLKLKLLTSSILNLEEAIMALYKDLFFSVELVYLGITNVPLEEQTDGMYDLLEPLYGPWIEQIAGRDFQKVQDMLKIVLNFTSAQNITQGLETINTIALADVNKENKELLDQMILNHELVQDLRDLAAFDNPALEKLLHHSKDSL